MNQPLHNNAIPAHPGIAAQQQQAASVAEPVAAPAPIESPPSSNAAALWDAFEGPQEPVSSPEPPPSPPVQAAPQPPAMPPTPPEVPPSVEDLLAGGASAPTPQVTEPPPVQAPVPAAPPPSAAPPFDMAVAQKQAIDYLMANEYKLNDEDRNRLISAPDEVLPQLAARMHVGIATQLAQQVAMAIPAMIQQHLDSHTKAQRAEMEFFSRYPKLNRPEWKPIIAESLQMVKQMSPQASRDEVIAKGAALAAFQINSRYGNNHQPQPPQPPRGPVQPYVPVAPGGGFSPPTNPNQQSNIWADLASDPDFNPW